MRVFRKYLNNRLSDPEFNRIYHDNCAICPITVCIVSAIRESNLPQHEIASQCGIRAEAMRDLETADHCCVLSVQKLCDYFGIPRPADCLKAKNKS